MNKNKKNYKALKVNKGVELPSSVNPNIKTKLANRFKKEKLTLEQYFNGIRSGNKVILSKAITLIESSLPEDKTLAKELINKCLPYSGNSVRIGITGVPGAGKSTFIETFGLYTIQKGKKVAVLAIDPSSTKTKGSILGDKIRMEKLSTNENVFIRPSSSAGTLGGVARNTRESMIILEAGGFNLIIVETVGVGQSETAVSQMTDFFILMMITGAGDDIQGIKRGIMEMSDMILINKADGDNIKKAEMTKQELEYALHLFQPGESNWNPKVLTVSAIENRGIDKSWQTINEYIKLTKENGYFELNRKRQLLQTLNENIKQTLIDTFYSDKTIGRELKILENMIADGKITPYQAAEKLFEIYFNGKP